MKRRAISLAAAFATLAVLSPSLADELEIRTRDGRSFTVPVSPSDIESMNFKRAAPAPAAAPPSAAAAITPPPAPRGNVVQVGPSRQMKLPSQAARAAKDGDTVEIDAGDYVGDVAIWSANNLTIRGVNGRARLRADGEAAQGKGIWVTSGRNIRVESIEFSGARVPDGNGAGIRAEGPGLTVVDCVFRDNQDGILAADNDGALVIERSEFAGNGGGDGRTHAIYIGHIKSLTVRGSWFRDTKIGHHIKSRAENNLIVANRITDEADGTASYEIDLPNGGTGFILANVIQKGSRADNSTAIAFAMEGATNATQALYVVGNTIVFDRPGGVFVRSRAPGKSTILNNILVGSGEVTQSDADIRGNLLVSDGRRAPSLPSSSDERNNKKGDPKFVDAARLDYRPTDAAAIAGGVAVMPVGPQTLLPVESYVHPLQLQQRLRGSDVEIGALPLAK